MGIVPLSVHPWKVTASHFPPKKEASNSHLVTVQRIRESSNPTHQAIFTDGLVSFHYTLCNAGVWLWVAAAP